MVAILSLIWIACGVVGYGTSLAFFQQEFPTLRTSRDVSFALLCGALGPIGLLVNAMSLGFEHGFQFFPQPAQSWDDYFKERGYDA